MSMGTLLCVHMKVNAKMRYSEILTGQKLVGVLVLLVSVKNALVNEM